MRRRLHFGSWTVESPSKRLHNLQPKHHRLCVHIPKQIWIFTLHIIASRRTKDSEIISNPCPHICLCNRSLDGETVQLQNGGRPSDVAHYTLALTKVKRAWQAANRRAPRLTRLDHQAHHHHPTQATAP